MIEDSKLLLFAIYNIISFKNDLKAKQLFRNTPKIQQKQNFKNLIRFVKNKIL